MYVDLRRARVPTGGWNRGTPDYETGVVIASSESEQYHEAGHGSFLPNISNFIFHRHQPISAED
jgi:hypothetical protein